MRDIPASKLSLKPVPVLLVGYNRPDLIGERFDDITRQDISRDLYIFIDGPKNETDTGSKATQDLAVDLSKKAKSSKRAINLYLSKTNLGCRRSIPTAISWALSSHDSLIILEDDVKPLHGFFEYMDYWLFHLRNEKNIFQINGWAPPIPGLSAPGNYLSRHAFCWGWGTWKDRWGKANIEMEDIDIESTLQSAIVSNNFGTNSLFYKIWLSRLIACKEGKDTWDYQWYLSIWSNSGSCLALYSSLTENVGFDERASRTRRRPEYSSIGNLDLVLSGSLSREKPTSRQIKKLPELDIILDYFLLGIYSSNSISSQLRNIQTRLKTRFSKIVQRN